MIRAALILALAPCPAAADVIALSCAFPSVCGANLTCADGVLTLRYEIDRNSRAVVLVEPDARVGVSVAQGEAAISFHTHLPTGGFHSTTVTAGGAAVHSRHMVIEGQLAPSQHYGTCVEGPAQ
ncbi:MAG TPA: hypothetical protein PKD10_12545 [Paracoccaceae bacterium]|nr:hypothetical protein [Paracoccaceae bacterium]HMO70258.1 hypothetical protein [Paracoccaceae bacterium]